MTPAEKQEADNALNHTFTVVNLTYTFPNGSPIDWEVNPTAARDRSGLSITNGPGNSIACISGQRSRTPTRHRQPQIRGRTHHRDPLLDCCQSSARKNGERSLLPMAYYRSRHSHVRLLAGSIFLDAYRSRRIPRRRSSGHGRLDAPARRISRPLSHRRQLENHGIQRPFPRRCPLSGIQIRRQMARRCDSPPARGIIHPGLSRWHTKGTRPRLSQCRIEAILQHARSRTRNKIALPTDYAQSLEKMFDVNLYLCMPDRTYANFNDSCAWKRP